MNIQEFYRQAHYLRNFDLTIESTMTIDDPNQTGRFLVLGRAVVGTVDLIFEAGGTPSNEVTFTTPTPILNLAGGGVVAFCGQCEDGVGAFGVYFDEQRIGVRRYDNANWSTGKGVIITGWFFYENGEPVV